MERKTIRKIIIVLSVLISLTSFLKTPASAFDIDNIFNAFSKTESDSSSSSVEINIVSPQVILQGSQMQMEFETPSSTSYFSVEWKSSNPDVISCTKDGVIKGVTKGKATITVKAKNGKLSDSITVYCVKKFEEPETVNLRFPFFGLTKHLFFMILKNQKYVSNFL